MPHPWTKELEHHGIVILHDLLTPPQLAGMQRAFAQRLRRQRFNDVDGYEKTERYRRMVQDVLVLDQGFVDAALDPRVTQVVREYVGPRGELVEAKGWESVPTKRDFHGWHGDAWYDQSRVTDRIPREVKLGIYLTDVTSGAFHYVRGSHGKQAPRTVAAHELHDVSPNQVLQVQGPAGTVFLFDTSGIHRQGVPILERRWAVFLNYHNPSVPLQTEDIAYYRYHPLLLNAAFLGGLTPEHCHLLGFGNKTNYLPDFQRRPEHPGFHALVRRCYDAKLFCHEWRLRITTKVKRWLGSR